MSDMELNAVNLPPLPEKPAHWRFVCEQLGLGMPRARPTPVTGGFHHRMWRLDTDSGHYAVKQLGPDTDATDAATVAHYNATEAVAEAFARHGIAVIHALRRQAGYLLTIDGAGYLVYPWTDAVALARKNLSEHHALRVAAVLAGMHRADVQLAMPPEAALSPHPEEKVALLVERATACHARDYQHLQQHLPYLLAIARRQPDARHILAQDRVIGHGDLTQENVLWSATGEPVVIDWESAHRLNATHETLLVALEWSGITSAFEHALFDQFLAAYRAAGGVIEHEFLQPAFDRIAGNWLDWLLFNVGRSINLADLEQRSLGAQQVELALATLLRLQRLLPGVLKGIRKQLWEAGPARRCSI